MISALFFNDVCFVLLLISALCNALGGNPHEPTPPESSPFQPNPLDPNPLGTKRDLACGGGQAGKFKKCPGQHFGKRILNFEYVAGWGPTGWEIRRDALRAVPTYLLIVILCDTHFTRAQKNENTTITNSV